MLDDQPILYNLLIHESILHEIAIVSKAFLCHINVVKTVN
jgi:hypothetical protein